MFEQFFEYFHFAYRQRTAFLAAVDTLKEILSAKVPFTKIGAAFMAVVELFSAAFWDTPRTPRGPELNLTGYELVFEDEFDGDALDWDTWEVVFGYADTVTVKDGNLVLTAEYREDGVDGPLWYRADLGTKEQFRYGYYEIRCKVFPNNSRQDIWSGFWLTNDNVYDAEISRGGIGSCEIDICESVADVNRNQTVPDTMTPALWCNGVDDDPDTIDGVNLGRWYVNNPSEEFNTYGLLWTEDCYIWYINGVESLRVNDYGSGPSQAFEQIRVSLCIPVCGHDNVSRGHDESADMTVDYVRLYQPAQ